MYALLDAPDDELAAALLDGRERFQSAFLLTADSQPLSFTLTQSPEVASVRQWLRENHARQLPCKLDFVSGSVTVELSGNRLGDCIDHMGWRTICIAHHEIGGPVVRRTTP